MQTKASGAIAPLGHRAYWQLGTKRALPPGMKNRLEFTASQASSDSDYTSHPTVCHSQRLTSEAVIESTGHF